MYSSEFEEEDSNESDDEILPELMTRYPNAYRYSSSSEEEDSNESDDEILPE